MIIVFYSSMYKHSSNINNRSMINTSFHCLLVDRGGPVVIILTTGSEVHEFKPGQGRWIFSERKNPEYVFLWKGSKAVGPVL